MLDMCSAPGGKSLMLAYMLFAQKGFPPAASENATTAASHTVRPHQGHATPKPDANADNASAINCSALSSLPQDTVEGSTAEALPQHDKLSSQAAAAAASRPSEHEQTTGRLAEQAQTSTHNPAGLESQVPCIHHRTDAIDLAEHGTLAELEECVPEPASTPATLSAQHGQNVVLTGSLTCNELDAPRRSRLQSVLDAYLPGPLKRKVRYDCGATLYWLPIALLWFVVLCPTHAASLSCLNCLGLKFMMVHTYMELFCLPG